MGPFKMKHPRPWPAGALTPERAVLLLAGIGMLALAGIPRAQFDPEPLGAITGVVTDAHGAVQAEVPVLLFQSRSASPSELTHTDHAGRFAFQLGFDRSRLIAIPRRGSGFSPTWRANITRTEGGDHDLRIELDGATALKVIVEDTAGFPMMGAEVVIFSSEQSGFLATDFARTDATGAATVLVTRDASLRVQQIGFRPWLDAVPTVGPFKIRLHSEH